jgi:alginate O-acetyltransferase complex protein AlgI
VRILFGLAKKLVLADVLALTVDERMYVATTRHAWTVVLAYSAEIFLDFSAYSDIAIGFARTLGIRLPENFRSPYLSRNIREFWDRWHITLSHWVRDYIFTPVSRKLFLTRMRRRPLAIAAISYVVTFGAVGVWHGVTRGFVIWGLYHGVLLTLYHVLQTRAPRSLVARDWYHTSRALNAARVAATFFFVTIGWVPFMVPWRQAKTILGLLFGVQA